MKISIIIPVYNAVSFLEECLYSIKEQTFNDWDCILVDDGSDDGSEKLCDEWVKRDSRFLVIHKENGGVSNARNIGLAKADGEYVLFVDSDDYVAPEYIERLIEPLQRHSFDMVLSGLLYFKDKGEVIEIESLAEQEWKLDDSENLLHFLQQPLVTSPVAKLYKKSIIEQNELNFDENLSLGEDRDFNIEYISQIQLASSVCYNGYYYRRNVPHSLTAQFHPDAFRNDIVYWNKLHVLLGNTGIKYQSHRLFNILVDNISRLLKQRGILYVWRDWNENRKIVDKNFLIQNLHEVVAPAWQKNLVRIFL